MSPEGVARLHSRFGVDESGLMAWFIDGGVER